MDWRPEFPQWFYPLAALLIVAEAVLARVAVVRARYRAADSCASFGMIAGNLSMNLLMAGTVLGGLSAAYSHRLYTLSTTSLWAWVAVIFLDDFTYYWFHRISHECRFWWAAHVNHHSSREYNLSVAVRQSWTGVIVGTWVLWVPLAFLGFPPEMILAQQGFSLIYQFWIHTESIGKMPRWFESISPLRPRTRRRATGS